MTISSATSSLTSSGYYTLASASSGGTAGATSGSASSSTATTLASIEQSFLLSLSPEAQNYLSGAGLISGSSDTSGSSLLGTSSSTTTAPDFTLTNAQQTTLNGIIEKYKGQPYTQATFDEIQSDLQAANLSPDQLAQSATIKAFNPTTTLLDSLFGTTSDTSNSSNSTADYTNAKNNYIQQVSAAFEKVAAPDSASTTASTSA